MFARRNDAMNAYNPFRMMDAMEREFFGEPFPAHRPPHPMFRTDVKDEGSEYVLEAELPGFEKKDIHLDLTGDMLTIRAERRREHTEGEEHGKYLTRERRYGCFRRSFDMTGIVTDDIRARYENGILTLTLPKQQDAQPESRSLDIE